MLLSKSVQEYRDSVYPTLTISRKNEQAYDNSEQVSVNLKHPVKFNGKEVTSLLHPSALDWQDLDGPSIYEASNRAFDEPILEDNIADEGKGESDDGKSYLKPMIPLAKQIGLINEQALQVYGSQCRKTTDQPLKFLCGNNMTAENLTPERDKEQIEKSLPLDVDM